MNQKLIVIDGISYTSVSEMPDDIRRKYEEAMRDMAINRRADDDGEILPNFGGAQTTDRFPGAKFIVDGVTYDSIDDLPAEARAKYENAMGSLDQNHNGVPDFLESFLGNVTLPTPSAPPSTDPKPTRRSAPPPAPPTHQLDTSNGWALVLGGLFLMGICGLGALGVWYFFLR